LFDALKKQFNHWGGGISRFFCFTHFSHDLMTSLLITMLPFIRQDMMLNYFQAGLLVSAYSITSGLSQILGGWVGDRIRHRWISITIGLIGVGVSGLATGMMYTFESLLTTMVFMGIFAGAYHPAAVPAISSLFEDRRGKPIGLHMIGCAVCFGLGAFIGTAIAATINWHMAFILLSIPALAAGVSVAVWLRKIEPDIPRHAVAEVKGKKADPDTPSLWQVLRKVSVVFILVIVVTFTSGSLLPFIPLYLVDHYNLSATMAAIWTSVLRASGIIGGLFGGWLSDRWGNRNTVLLALVAIGPAIMLFTTVGYFPALAVMMIVIGILWMMRETVVQTYLMTRTPPRMHGMVVGIYFGIGQQGQSLLQPVYGVFMDMAGISTVFLVVGLISLATSIITIFLARKI